MVETFPGSSPELVEAWELRVAGAGDDRELVTALVGRALSSYWAAPLGVIGGTWEEVARRRVDDCERAEAVARAGGDPTSLVTALLGTLYARWGPDHLAARPRLVEELRRLRPAVEDLELRLRIDEWVVLGHLDAGRLGEARREVGRFRQAARRAPPLFRRREELWRANLAMLEGRIDESVRLNQAIVSDTADEAGSPFAFQNAAITVAIERFLRRGLADVVEAIRSIRSSSPRVASNWDAGLCFALAEVGRREEARRILDDLAAAGFAAIPRDLNWLVTVHLLGLVAITLDDAPRCAELLELLRPHAGRDATHGSGYASYGPVGRVVGSLAARAGDLEEAERWFEHVLLTREDGPWTSLTRLDRARALQAAGRSPARSIADAAAADVELRAFGLTAWADAASAIATELRLAGHGGPIARLQGGRWTLRHDTGAVTLPDGVGVRHLVALLARPGQLVDVLELDPPAELLLPRDTLAEPPVDRDARTAYRRRLRELAGRGDLDDEARAERDHLRRQLAAARRAPSASGEVERARLRVTKALSRTLGAVAERSPGLGRHLAESLETGRRCTYRPGDGRAWSVHRGRGGASS